MSTKHQSLINASFDLSAPPCFQVSAYQQNELPAYLGGRAAEATRKELKTFNTQTGRYSTVVIRYDMGDPGDANMDVARSASANFDADARSYLGRIADKAKSSSSLNGILVSAPTKIDDATYISFMRWQDVGKATNSSPDIRDLTRAVTERELGEISGSPDAASAIMRHLIPYEQAQAVTR